MTRFIRCWFSSDRKFCIALRRMRRRPVRNAWREPGLARMVLATSCGKGRARRMRSWTISGKPSKLVNCDILAGRCETRKQEVDCGLF